MEIEKRSLMQAPELRAEGNQVAGFAVRYNSETVIAGVFREKFAPGAFSEAIKGDIRALFNHDSSKVLGRTKSGTLRLNEDESGLTYDVDLPDTTVGRDLKISMERGDIDGSSFGFTVKREEWDESGDLPLRTIYEAGLMEVSPVTFPAYEDSAIALRSRDEKTESEKAQAEKNRQRAEARIAERKARMEMQIRKMDSEPDNNIMQAMKWLEKAMKRHERHMSGDEPTTEASQAKMMDEMKSAMSFLEKL